MKKYEYIELEGGYRESGIYKYPVSLDLINEYGQDGWKFCYTTNDGFTVVMERELSIA